MKSVEYLHFLRGNWKKVIETNQDTAIVTVLV